MCSDRVDRDGDLSSFTADEDLSIDNDLYPIVQFSRGSITQTVIIILLRFGIQIDCVGIIPVQLSGDIRNPVTVSGNFLKCIIQLVME